MCIFWALRVSRRCKPLNVYIVNAFGHQVEAAFFFKKKEVYSFSVRMFAPHGKLFYGKGVYSAYDKTAFT